MREISQLTNFTSFFKYGRTYSLNACSAFSGAGAGSVACLNRRAVQLPSYHVNSRLHASTNNEQLVLSYVGCRRATQNRVPVQNNTVTAAATMVRKIGDALPRRGDRRYDGNSPCSLLVINAPVLTGLVCRHFHRHDQHTTPHHRDKGPSTSG